ncbi:MAG: SH3 domain-containing protein [Chloroflexi bacterium]|nr:SH3 domain-containing protein [Chloroflexota bacterium]
MPAQAVTGACAVTVLRNLNLRTEPSADSERLLTIPYTTVLTASEKSADNWWRVTYDGLDGWVSGEFVTVDSTCP